MRAGSGSRALADAGAADRAPEPQASPDAVYLADRAALIAHRAQRELERRAAAAQRTSWLPPRLDALPIDQAARGLRPAPSAPSDEWAFNEAEARADALVESTGRQPRLRTLAAQVGLSRLETDVLLAAALPDLSWDIGIIYGNLSDNMLTRHATIGLALTLCEEPIVAPDARASFAADGPLFDYGLLHLLDDDLPYPSRRLVAPDRVLGYLLGEDRDDLDQVPGVRVHAPGSEARRGGFADDLVTTLRQRVGRVPAQPVFLRDPKGGTAATVARAALSAVGRPAVVVDWPAVAGQDDAAASLAVVRREAVLAGAGIVCGPVDTMSDEHKGLLNALVRPGIPLALYGPGRWDPGLMDTVPDAFTVPALSAADREAVWRQEFGACPPDCADALAAAVAAYRLDLEQISATWSAARRQGPVEQDLPTPGALTSAARQHNAGRLEELAHRIEPQVGWDALVLPDDGLARLHDLTARARHRERVLGQWGMRPGGARGRGVVGLFAGPSGTGKTMSAEVMARDLGLDMYVVQVATIVDKYIGETEKNLERIFAEADSLNGLLVFDEADALFGRRSEAKDAHDRYANVQTAYLLQRLETFDGLAVLTTNLRSNMDDAFVRRLDAVVEFPMPDQEHRRRLWRGCLAPVPLLGDDVDLDFLARSFPLSGGSIRAAAVTAAYRASAHGGPLVMEDVIEGVRSEYTKSGNLLSASEFGPYHKGRSTASPEVTAGAQNHPLGAPA